MTLIFDIGKTNKKVFLFDSQYRIVYEESHRISEIKDEDGDACDDLDSLISWIHSTIKNLTAHRDYKISAINFSSFGASLVHINELGKPFLPLYSYLKPLSPALKDKFFNDYGGQDKISRQTASPVLDSLNSGLQLYRLKYEKAIHEKPGYSLHLPQFLSYLVTKKVYSEITSIGCHTMLWNFEINDYHEWVHREGIIKRLAPIYPSTQLLDADRYWGDIKAGVGLHDSSSAIIPYLATFRHPFVLISTGTWSISLNPFNETPLTSRELAQDCLCFLSYKKRVVKASRFFAGNFHDENVKKVADHFNKDAGFYNTVNYDRVIILYLKEKIEQDQHTSFQPGNIMFTGRDLNSFRTAEEAYHQLMLDIIHQQVLSTNLVLRGTNVRKIFVDGGFSKSNLYMGLLADAYKNFEVFSASVAQASAIGAALAMHTGVMPEDIISMNLQQPSSP